MQLYKKAEIYIQIVSNIKHGYCTLQVKLCARPFNHQEILVWQLMNMYWSFSPIVFQAVFIVKCFAVLHLWTNSNSKSVIIHIPGVFLAAWLKRFTLYLYNCGIINPGPGKSHLFPCIFVSMAAVSFHRGPEIKYIKFQTCALSAYKKHVITFYLPFSALNVLVLQNNGSDLISRLMV